jgi:hypothetical protein
MGVGTPTSVAEKRVGGGRALSPGMSKATAWAAACQNPTRAVYALASSATPDETLDLFVTREAAEAELR